MDKNYVKAMLEGLNSSSSRRIQDSLLKIKSHVIINDRGVKLFRDCGGLNYLLPHLRKPNEKILDITLSILGNICLEEKSSILIGKLQIFGPIVSILNTVCRDSILGRTSRVIGNLAQNQKNAESLHSHGAVNALVALIENRDKNTSYATLSMAVRAIRQLWMIKDKRKEMLNANAIRCISILLTTECENMGIIKSSTVEKEIEEPKKSQEELINSILKCLGYFTTYPVSTCAEQIQGDGRGYQCLVALTKTHESVSLKCLMNLCYLSTCRPLLGIAGIVECLVGILQKHSDPSCWPIGAVKALAQLSGESVNRSRIRRCGGLSLLVQASRDNSHAMYALLQYVFDDTSFQILIQEGLVGLLTEKLTAYISTMEYDHILESTDPATSSEPFRRKERPKNEPGSVYDIALQNLTQSSLTRGNLFTRRKSLLLSETGDDLKVVIERDNMIVGFVDAIDSDGSEDSDSDDEEDEDEEPPSKNRRGTKRGRSSPKIIRKKSRLIKMASKDWSAGVYWEPKSPEWPSLYQQFPDTSPGRDMPMSPVSDGNFSDFSPDRESKHRWDWSPDSGASSGECSSASPQQNDYPWSPGSSMPSSPASTTNDEDSSDSEVSGRYSPVCTDAEGDTEDEQRKPTPSTSNDAKSKQLAQDLEELDMDNETEITGEESPTEEGCKIDISSKASGIACVMVLLFRVSHGTCTTCGSIRDDPVPNQTMDLLTSRDCLNGLLDYVERCKRPVGRAARILARVLSNDLCLMSILRHRLAIRLHRMSVYSKHPPDQCTQCKQILKLSSKLLCQLGLLAESSYGIGKISYNLLKGCSSMKQTLALTLPYIVRAEKPLKKYMIDCNGLNQLFHIISESKEDIEDCIKALVKIANNINLKDPKDPKVLDKKYKDKVHVNYDPILDNLAPEDIVIFQLDDSTTVRANRIFLCQHSEVFSAMLMGKFKESGEKCVQLKNVSKGALEYLFTLLHCGLNNPKCEIEVFPMVDNLNTSLEVLLLADRFLFEKLKDLLSSAILQFKMTPNTADRIYIWSLSEGMGFLCSEAVAYLLIGKMTETERFKSFKNILTLPYKDQWLEDVKGMLMRQLVK